MRPQPSWFDYASTNHEEPFLIFWRPHNLNDPCTVQLALLFPLYFHEVPEQRPERNHSEVALVHGTSIIRNSYLSARG